MVMTTQAPTPLFTQVSQALDLIAPSLSSVATATLEQYWDLIRCQVSANYLACSTPIMGAYLLAHYYTLATDANYQTAGVMAEQSLGQATVKFNVGKPSDNPLWADMSRTQYGISWYGMAQRMPIGAMASNMSVYMGGAIIPLPPPPYFNGIPTGYIQGY